MSAGVSVDHFRTYGTSISRHRRGGGSGQRRAGLGGRDERPTETRWRRAACKSGSRPPERASGGGDGCRQRMNWDWSASFAEDEEQDLSFLVRRQCLPDRLSTPAIPSTLAWPACSGAVDLPEGIHFLRTARPRGSGRLGSVRRELGSSALALPRHDVGKRTPTHLCRSGWASLAHHPASVINNWRRSGLPLTQWPAMTRSRHLPVGIHSLPTHAKG